MNAWIRVTLAVFSLAVIADSCSGSSNGSSTGTAQSPSTSSSSHATPAPTPTPIADLPLSGNGQTATAAFPVVGGLTIFKAHCGCNGNFAIEILNGSGKSVDIPVNVIGSYTGAVAEGLDGGNYILKVDADAPWTVIVSQPRRLQGAALPQTYTGHGQQVVGPFSSNGGVRLVAQNKGSSNFAVEVRDEGGASKDIPINEIGAYNGSTISDLSGGNYWLNVDSDGDWSIVVSKP